jgi:transposase InsO family protein
MDCNAGPAYGSPRVRAMLRRHGIRVGEKRVARLMRLAGLQGAYRRRRKGCTTGVDGVEPFGDLVGRDFRPDAPDRVWAADIKQIKTGEGRPVSGRGARSLQPPDRRLGDGGPHALRARRRGA